MTTPVAQKAMNLSWCLISSSAPSEEIKHAVRRPAAEDIVCLGTDHGCVDVVCTALALDASIKQVQRIEPYLQPGLFP